MKTATDETGTAKARWERETVQPALSKSPERSTPFTTISGRPVERLYTPEDLADWEPARDLSTPGEFPYTRGIHPTGYRGKLWTMRQFSGFGTPEQTNDRYKHLLAAGGTGLSVAFDLPTLMGRDPDHELSLSGEWRQHRRWPTWRRSRHLPVGYHDVDDDHPSAPMFAMPIGPSVGADWRRSGTIRRHPQGVQEYILRGPRCGSPTCSASAKWNTISVSG